ncbi:MAG: SH3 domain-containing protein [Rickettsiaceae bacterium]|nr:SH3 domain-containing protein [Rickettsiaceae bacterium]
MYKIIVSILQYLAIFYIIVTANIFVAKGSILDNLQNYTSAISFSDKKNIDKKISSLPRFASIKSAEANSRTGPGHEYQVVYLYQYKHLPVEIIAEYGQWRKIRDIKGDQSWMHASILSGRRTVIVHSLTEENLYKSNNRHSNLIARLEPQIVCQLYKCEKTWCKVSCDDYVGWINRSSLWGVYEYEG